jgi:hypothetical protein
MVTLHIGKISGLGVLYFADLPACQGTFEIDVVEENGAPRISVRFGGKPKIWRMEDTIKPTLQLADGEPIKLQR